MTDAVEPVLVEHSDSVLTMTINRPEARNAVNRAVAIRLAAALDELDARDDLRVGIITGAGGTFSAGMDLKAFLAGEDVEVGDRGFAGVCSRPPRKPLLAAVEGWALAGGCEITLTCDLIVAARDAKFGIPEVKRGLIAGAGGLLRLPRKVPPAVAMQLALTGDPITAEQAERFGLVNVLTEPGAALDGARALAARIIGNGPLAVAASKQLVAGALDVPVDEGFARQAPVLEMISGSDDAREGATAFAEKRSPVWRGR